MFQFFWGRENDRHGLGMNGSHLCVRFGREKREQVIRGFPFLDLAHGFPLRRPDSGKEGSRSSGTFCFDTRFELESQCSTRNPKTEQVLVPLRDKGNQDEKAIFSMRRCIHWFLGNSQCILR